MPGRLSWPHRRGDWEEPSQSVSIMGAQRQQPCGATHTWAPCGIRGTVQLLPCTSPNQHVHKDPNSGSASKQPDLSLQSRTRHKKATAAARKAYNSAKKSTERISVTGEDGRSQGQGERLKTQRHRPYSKKWMNLTASKLKFSVWKTSMNNIIDCWQLRRYFWNVYNWQRIATEKI